MRTDEILLLQALKFKQLSHHGFSGPDLVERVLEANPEEAKKSMRNICAFISPELFQEIEEIRSLLEFSKRQIVEMALLDFVEKAKKIVADNNIFPE